MKVTIYLLILSLHASFALAEEPNAQELSIGVSIWAPYIREKESGIALGKLEQIMEYSAFSYSVSYYPFKRLLRQAADHQISIAALLTRTPTRDKQLLFSEPLYCDRRFIYSHTPKQGSDLSGIKGQTLGVGIGINYGKNFEKEVIRFGITVQKFPTPQVLLRALQEKRVSNILISEREAESLKNQKKAFATNSIRKAANAFSQMELHLALPLSNESKERLNLINDSIISLKLREGCN
ncbi:substrate-binding periplasmic protein [Neptuniibacter sp. QD29_5]|uniref:substrate-binding periplasmic protein n=1 Tax=Neptuniibacter sp. QD29_5 TaxID=3398207 RepID=UPI0039F5AAE1